MTFSLVPIMPSIPSLSANQLSNMSYPRTGKRGVPQQFARRLYDMLQSEAKLDSGSHDEGFIKWSESGFAFRILDVKSFTSTVLPKYFRTKKFSSFQRNLNLYGFSKVRRGPDTDMYAHPSFVRGKPELLVHLRKCSSASSRRKGSRSIGDESDVSTTGSCSNSRSCSSCVDESPKVVTPVTPPKVITQTLSRSSKQSTVPARTNFQNCPLMPKSFCKPHSPLVLQGGIGRLDLLALAVEHAM